MNIQNESDVLEFMKGIRSCRGNVFFESPTDKIDLKSVLSQYVFFSMLNDEKLMKDGKIRCEDEEDLPKIAKFLE